MKSAATQREPRAVPSDLAAPSSSVWWRSTFALALLGQLLLVAALPPLGWSVLGWLAPVPWVWLIAMPSLPGKRPYAALWLASFLGWLAILHWMTLPHWATSFGWIALCFYLAFYFPVFIGLSRVAVHRWRVPAIVAAPIVWTGLELARAHLLSGFSMGSLAHSQYRWPQVIQISDLAGAYAVSFVMILAGACLAQCLTGLAQRRGWQRVAAPAIVGTAALALVWGYGQWKLDPASLRPGPRVALIQGSIDIEMKHDPTQSQRIFDEYFDLSRRAVAEHPDVELIVWPETMFPYPWFTFDEHPVVIEEMEITPAEAMGRSQRAVENTVTPLRVPMLLGIGTLHAGKERMERYNTALFVERDGQVLGRYDKVHRVMFGEYVPFAETFPWLYGLTPLPYGLDAGPGPSAVQVGTFRYAPNICFEDTVPHLIRQQVVTLRDKKMEPDVLVNSTNDGWFWGSSELDLHLACAVFRAVECRKPFLVAANTGFSAWIDAAGQIRQQGPRRATGVVFAETQIDPRGSWYLDHGDLPAAVCLAVVLALAGWGLRDRWVNRKVIAAM